MSSISLRGSGIHVNVYAGPYATPASRAVKTGNYSKFVSTTQMAKTAGAERLGRPGTPSRVPASARYDFGPGFRQAASESAAFLDGAFAVRWGAAKSLLFAMSEYGMWGKLNRGGSGWSWPGMPAGACKWQPRQAGCSTAPEGSGTMWGFSIAAGPAATCGTSEACPFFAASRPALPVNMATIGTWPFNAVNIHFYRQDSPGVIQETDTWSYPATSSPPAVGPSYGPLTATAPLQDPFPETETRTMTAPKASAAGSPLRPYEVPADVSIELPGSGKPRPGPPVHGLYRPQPGEKEDKKQFPGKKLAEGYGFLTEVGDAVDCLQKNIKFPKSGRYGATRQPLPAAGLQNRIAWVVDQTMRGNLDVVGFMNCFAQNQLTDSLVGKLSGPANRNFNQSPYNPRRGLGLGFGSGGFSTRMR